MKKVTIRGAGFTVEKDQKEPTAEDVVAEYLYRYQAQIALLQGENAVLRSRIKDLEATLLAYQNKH